MGKFAIFTATVMLVSVLCAGCGSKDKGKNDSSVRDDSSLMSSVSSGMDNIESGISSTISRIESGMSGTESNR